MPVLGYGVGSAPHPVMLRRRIEHLDLRQRDVSEQLPHCRNLPVTHAVSRAHMITSMCEEFHVAIPRSQFQCACMTQADHEGYSILAHSQCSPSDCVQTSEGVAGTSPMSLEWPSACSTRQHLGIQLLSVGLRLGERGHRHRRHAAAALPPLKGC